MYCYWHKLTCLIYLNTFICNLWTFFFIKYNNVNKFAEMAIKVLIDWLIDWLIDQLIDWSIDLYCTYLCIKCIYLFVCLFAYLKWSNLSLQFKESNKLINIVICANSTQHINTAPFTTVIIKEWAPPEDKILANLRVIYIHMTFQTTEMF